MAIDYQRLKNLAIPEVEQVYTAKDTILYALGLGFGADPVDPDQLKFVYEDALKALPTMPVVLAPLARAGVDLGINRKLVVHGEQGLTLHKPVPTAGTVIGRTYLDEIVDKGAGKGALLLFRREVLDKETGELIASITSTTFARGDGGFGGPSGPTKPIHELPTRAPDLSCDIPTLPQAALIYRLSGDYNPLHADPGFAKAGGFPRPILHGLCTYGVAGHALLRLLCDYDPTRLKRIDVRFSAPVYPGETIRTEIWREGAGRFGFRCRVVERDVIAINNGLAEVA
ncbi:MAG TPA: MaoC/PaaZ C-terminal domain-containing protein [Stellaceae bacterium]|nr:MaoC/PaaZ C-terminal domain-containing protein [Stellaceae bacterium]